mgnify:CR=1 FL=1
MNYIVGNQSISEKKLDEVVKKIVNLLVEEKIKFGLCDLVLDQVKDKIYDIMNDEYLKSINEDNKEIAKESNPTNTDELIDVINMQIPASNINPSVFQNNH